MKLSECKLPFRGDDGWLRDSNGSHIASSVVFSEELCSILNAHFQTKEFNCHIKKPEDQIKLEKEFSDSLNATPQPNREETDRVAMEFIKSGRKLAVQRFEDGEWQDHKSGMMLPSFHYEIPWRIKPKKRRVVVEVHETPLGKLLCCAVSDGNVAFPRDYRFLGTIEGEVEG